MGETQVFNTFRNTFKNIDKELLHWFPGHMGKGLKQMQQKLRSVDCIIEVRDARIPLSGQNTDFKYKISGIKPHIIVLNKMDLVEKSDITSIQSHLEKESSNVIFTNCKDPKCKGVYKIFPTAQNLIHCSERYNRSNTADFCIMIIGIPNVGKSSLVNTLRNRFLHKAKASAVGAAPGITRSVLNRIKISEKPPIYMLDTPGILAPTVQSTEVGLKLALCATIQEHLIGEPIIADYLLYWLNKHNLFNYVEVFRLKNPTDNILEVLTKISLDENKSLKYRDASNTYVIKPDINSAAQLMIKAFRSGDLGKIMLDKDIINT